MEAVKQLLGSAEDIYVAPVPSALAQGVAPYGVLILPHEADRLAFELKGVTVD